MTTLSFPEIDIPQQRDKKKRTKNETDCIHELLTFWKPYPEI